jgi:hypothetical protein
VGLADREIGRHLNWKQEEDEIQIDVSPERPALSQP